MCVQIFAETRITHLNGCWFHAAILLKVNIFSAAKGSSFVSNRFSFHLLLSFTFSDPSSAGIAKGENEKNTRFKCVCSLSSVLLVQLREKPNQMNVKDKWPIIYHSSHGAIRLLDLRAFNTKYWIRFCFGNYKWVAQTTHHEHRVSLLTSQFDRLKHIPRSAHAQPDSKSKTHRRVVSRIANKYLIIIYSQASAAAATAPHWPRIRFYYS